MATETTDVRPRHARYDAGCRRVRSAAMVPALSSALDLIERLVAAGGWFVASIVARFRPVALVLGTL